jgi:hypothetical protein
MAKTKAGKKKIYVHEHQRGDSTVKRHYRSTPNPRSKLEKVESPSIFGWLSNFFN